MVPLKHASILLEVIVAVVMMVLSPAQMIPVLILMNVRQTLVKTAKDVLIQNVFYQMICNDKNYTKERISLTFLSKVRNLSEKLDYNLVFSGC